MDRTAEYNKFAEVECVPEDPYEDRFYDTIAGKLQGIAKALKTKKSYSQVLASEQELGAAVKESSLLLDAIEVEGSADEVRHFEGIKQIINLKITSITLEIQDMKHNLISYSANLEPERPVLFAQNKHFLLEEDNQKLVEKFRSETTELSATRRKLLEIEKIQDLINIHLSEQDERIDSIVVSTVHSKQNLHQSNTYFLKNKNTGRFMRRMLSVLLLCMAFVLLTSHLFHR